MARQNETEKQFYLDHDLLTKELLDKWRLTATSIFIYRGIEDEFLSDHIERQLYQRGSVVFFKDKEDGVYKVLDWAQRSGLNVYGYPYNWYTIGLNGHHQPHSEDDSVMIWNNKLRRPTRPYVELMVRKLVNIEETIDMNINGIKTPFIFSGTENRILTLKNLYRKISGNVPVVYEDSKLSLDSKLEVFNTGVEFHGANLMMLYSDYEGRILNYLGLKYVGAKKKERLVVDEANSGDEFTVTNLQSMFKSRKDAIEKINKMFGLSITVELNPLLLQEGEDDEEHTEDNEEAEQQEETK